MGESVIQRSFASGELAPVLHSRADQVRYTQGLRTCRNFMVRREGGAQNRAGLRYMDPCKTNTAGTRLVRYVGSEPGESVLIEMGNQYFRFFRDGASVDVSSVPAWSSLTAYLVADLVAKSGVNYYCIKAHTNHTPPNTTYWYPLIGAIYEVPTPWTLAGGLPDWNQSGNVLTFCHPDYPPYELIYETDTRWILRQVNTGPSVDPPTGLWGSAGAAGTHIYTYVVTSAALETLEESEASSSVQIVDSAEPTTGVPNQIGWTAATGVGEYHVYCDRSRNGIFGYIGSTSTNGFHDTGQAPDMAMTPPVFDIAFSTTGDYPAHCANYQQRRFFANTDDKPDAIWGSRIGFLSNFGVSSPLQDDDAIAFRIAGNNHHPIRHLVSLKAGLVLMTDGGEWTVCGGGGPRYPITPSSIDAEQETYVGVSAEVRPVVVGDSILYVQARGSIVRDLRFEQQIEGLAGRDLGIWASHLFERQTIIALDYQQNPHSIIWCVRDDGVLLGLTYIPDQDVWGWHRHETDGLIEDVCVLPEADEDALYLIVARTIGGTVKRYIERLERRDIRAATFDADCFFVDSGLSYSGTATNTLTGLDHLEGKVVAVLADGVVLSNGHPPTAQVATYTVTAGTIVLPVKASNVHIGLPIDYPDIETLDLDVQGVMLRDKRKRVGSVTVLLEQSARTLSAGPDTAHLRTYTANAWESTDDLYTGPVEIVLAGQWDQTGRVLIRMTDPLPITILGILPNVDIGG